MIHPVIEETDTVILLDFEPQLPCEGALHGQGLSGHIVTEPGAFVVKSPCPGGIVIIQCAPRVHSILSESTLLCTECGHDHPIEEYQFIPLRKD